MSVEAELVHKTLPLRDIVAQLSLNVFKRLLASEALQLELENEAYALLRAWLRQSPHAQGKRRALFKELAPLLRYHHMTHDFLANDVCSCSFMQESGLLTSVVRAAFVQREASAAVLQEREIVRGRPNRGVGPSEASWELKTSFTLEEVAALEPDGYIKKWCGLVAGYPTALGAKRMKPGNTLGVYLCTLMAPSPTDLQGALPAGFALEVNWTLTPNIKMSFIKFVTVSDNWGFGDVFGKPWAEAVREGSLHFPNGKLEMKVTAKLIAKE